MVGSMPALAKQPALRELHRDQRGAIMLMGLGIACFLIGALWYIIGIGDALVFRNTMQEVADHAAFAGAVVHAKGMNLISTCNLILFALVVVHLILGVISDLLFGLSFIPVLAWMKPTVVPAARNIWNMYASVIMRPVGTGIHYIELTVAVGYPWVAKSSGSGIGSAYESHHSIGSPNISVWSGSMIPGGVLNQAASTVDKGLKKTPDEKKSPWATVTKKVGLPVEAKHFDTVCDKVALDLESWFGSQLSWVPDIIMEWAPTNWIKTILNTLVRLRYCNDMGGLKGSDGKEIKGSMKDLNAMAGWLKKGLGKVMQAANDPGFNKWWGTDGPLVPLGGSTNGDEWHQVWAYNKTPYKDTSDHRVAIAKRVFDSQETGATTPEYFAQAEFYFDCTKKWSEVGCNKDDDAGYSLKWRARLRKYKPELWTMVGSLLGSYIGNSLQSMWNNKVDEQIKDWKAKGEIAENSPLMSLVNKWVTGKMKLPSNATSLGEWIGGLLDGTGPTNSYH
jgi:hypothetical protein